ncbi:MAG: tRNA guanosine(34) transglycosylase Tgt [Nanoarchaeota archaeon]|nr:tRNA guanosine(34) transglycosylase Tgt [Nanoarchaeota archaeon]
MFQIINQDKARTGIFKVKNKKIETPFFMPCATFGSGKVIGTDDYKKIGINAIIANAFLLSLKPGIDILSKKGIHKFINYNKIIFNDCGGFQVIRDFFIKKTDRGIYFRNPFDNKEELLNPEKIMEIYSKIKSDVIMVLDDMAPLGSDYEYCKDAVKNTLNWGKKCLELNKKHKKQDLFGIVQGGLFKELREKCAKEINKLDFDGNAIGGLAIGESKKEMYKILNYVIKYLDKNKIRYLMGVGSPEDIVKSVELGIDCFDSVFPTQNARHGTLFTFKSKVYISKCKKDFNPIEEDCGCFVCKSYSRAYLYHLYKIKESLVKRYLSYHNLYFMNELMKKIRLNIKENSFGKFKKEFFKIYE